MATNCFQAQGKSLVPSYMKGAKSVKKIGGITVVGRKLGRERAFGQCKHASKVIEWDTRQDARELIDTLSHEALHLMCPEWNESKVTRTANTITKILWAHNFRRVED